MSQNKWLYLQRFAEGGDGGTGAGGEGADSGVSPGNPGRARLLELGVPAHAISPRAEEAVSRRMDASRAQPATAQDAAVQQKQPTEEPEQKDTQKAQEPPPDALKRMTWKEITADPEYSRELQKTIQGRLKTAKAAEEQMQSMAGALEVLARKYGMDPAKPDYAALGKAIEADTELDDRYYADLAGKTGLSVAAAQELDRRSRETERQRLATEASMRELAMAQHFAGLETQARELQKTYPGFDLREAMADERFARAVSPGGGLTVEQAYTAFHWQEIQAAQNELTAKKLREEMAKSIQGNQHRPQELGTSGTAPSVTGIDWRKATPAQLREFNARLAREGTIPL